MDIDWPSTKIVYIFNSWKTWLPGVESDFLIWKNLLQILPKYYLAKLFQEYHQSVKQLRSKQFWSKLLQMLSVEKTLARVNRSCQKFLGYLKKKISTYDP